MVIVTVTDEGTGKVLRVFRGHAAIVISREDMAEKEESMMDVGVFAPADDGIPQEDICNLINDAHEALHLKPPTHIIETTTTMDIKRLLLFSKIRKHRYFISRNLRVRIP